MAVLSDTASSTPVCACGATLPPVHALCSCGMPLCLPCAQESPQGCHNLGHDVQRRNTYCQTDGDDRAVVEQRPWSSRICLLPDVKSLVPCSPVLELAGAIITRGRFWHLPKASLPKLVDALDAALNTADKTFWTKKTASWCGRKGVNSGTLTKSKSSNGNAAGHLCFIVHAFFEFNCSMPGFGGYSSYAFGGSKFIVQKQFYQVLRQALAGIQTTRKHLKVLIAAFDLLFAYTPIDPFGATGFVDGKVTSSHLGILRYMVRQRDLDPFLRHFAKVQRGESSFRDAWRGRCLGSKKSLKPPKVKVEGPKISWSQWFQSINPLEDDEVCDEKIFLASDDELDNQRGNDASDHESVVAG